MHRRLSTFAFGCFTACVLHAQETPSTVDILSWKRTVRPDAASLARQRDFSPARQDHAMPSTRGFVTDVKAIGVQLDGGGRLMLRRKNGGPAVTYRSQF